MEIEREAPGGERGRSWRANAAQDAQDGKKFEDGDETLVKVQCSLLLFLCICRRSSSAHVHGVSSSS